MQAAVEISHVSKTYYESSAWWRGRPKGNGFQALRDVNLSIQHGEFFGLLGPNGAGKTSLISILAGLARATSGQVKVCGYDVVDDFQSARRALGVVPQELVFDPFFTVRESLRFQSGYFGLKNNDDWIDEILENLGLSDKANVNMRALSGGMKRRVLVAQALVHKPPVIVLDEPTAGVDVDLRRTLWEFIARLNHKGHTVLLTTHYLEEAQELCDRIALLKAGQIVALDTTDALLGYVEGVRVSLRLSTPWRHGVLVELDQCLLICEGQQIVLALEHARDLERILASIREAGYVFEDIQVSKADLEDAFVTIINSTSGA